MPCDLHGLARVFIDVLSATLGAQVNILGVDAGLSFSPQDLHGFDVVHILMDQVVPLCVESNPRSVNALYSM